MNKVKFKTKQKGVAMVMMIAVLLFLSFVAVALDYWADLKRAELRENSFDLMVKHESDTVEYAMKAIDSWFNLEGRALLYGCEVTVAGCDSGIIKNILPDYYASITTQEYKSINSVALGYKAGVVKLSDSNGGWVYKMILYPNL